jgi:hypothetical protein
MLGGLFRWAKTFAIQTDEDAGQAALRPPCRTQSKAFVPESKKAVVTEVHSGGADE